MSERMTTWVRLSCIVLVVLNVLVFTFFKLRPDPGEAMALRIKEVQINAGSVKLIAATARGAGEATASTPAGACLEWGPVSSADVTAADSALDKIGLAPPAVRRPATDSAGGEERFSYFVREPDKTVVGQIAELQRTFPDTRIKAGKCPEELVATPPNGEPPR